MQLEMPRWSCPLCRRLQSAHPAESAPVTKLCEQCRGIVEKAFRFGESPVLAPPVQQSTLALADSRMLIHEAAVLISPLIETTPSLLESSEERSSMFLATSEDLEPDIVLDANPDPGVGIDPLLDSFDFGENGHSRHWNEFSTEAEPALNTVNSLEAEASSVELSTDDEHPANLLGNEISGAVEQQHEYPKWGNDETDSVVSDDVLARWDYSRDTWPVLVAPAKRGSSARPRASIVVLAVLACVAGLYFVLNQGSSSRETRKAGERDGASASAHVAPKSGSETGTAVSDTQNQLKAPESKPSEIAASKPDQAIAADTHNGTEDAQLRFSLQAAAFPNRAEADQFSEKLKRAGLPSYVVGTDLAKRGKWFRVRVGSFKTAGDAQAFGREAQTRSKAAGISLQLIVCQYERP